MKKIDIRNNILIVSIGIILTTLALVSCEKRDDDVLGSKQEYSKTVVFTETADEQTRAYYNNTSTTMPTAEYVLSSEDSSDNLFMYEYVSDFSDESIMTRASQYETSDLNNFDVLCYTGSGAKVGDLCNMVIKNGTEWHYDPEINWSKVGSASVAFYAYANVPTSAAISQPNNGNPTLTYTNIPELSSNQVDIVVAKTPAQYNSATTSKVPLSFNHICAGVQFVLDDLTQAGKTNGTFTSIKLVDIASDGAVYDMVTGEWDVTNSNIKKKTFELANNGNSVNYNEVFMLVPQKLGGSAKIEIEFQSATSGLESYKQKFTYDLANIEWSAGKIYKYKISTNKIEAVAFTSAPNYIDAHYIVDSIEFVSTGGWTLTSSSTDLKFTTTLIDLEKQGYYIENTSKSTSLTGSKGSHKVYIHVVEYPSTTEEYRDIKLTLKPSSGKSVTKTIRQFAPYWTIDGYGCERIEEVDNEQWGPYWKLKSGEEAKVTYSINKSWSLVSFFFDLIRNDVLDDIINGNLVTTSGINFSMNEPITYTINYTDFLTQEFNEDGWNNTYNATASTSMVKMEVLERILSDYTSNVTKTYDITDYSKSAILSSQKKNKFTYKTVEGKNVPDLAEENKLWFCPSLEECRDKNILRNNPNLINQQVEGEDGLVDIETDMSGKTYWTSTAKVVPGNNIPDAEKYLATSFSITNNIEGKGNVLEEFRMNKHSVRACRKK